MLGKYLVCLEDICKYDYVINTGKLFMKINIDEMEWQESNQENFHHFRKSLGTKAGGKMLGASLYKLLPGKKAFPFHFHHANEEAIFVISGNGTLRINTQEILIKPNDYIALPRGSEHAHQMINTSNIPLEYLCISTMIEPEVMEYPDSNKLGVMTCSAPGGEKKPQSFKAFYRKDDDVSYYDNEK